MIHENLMIAAGKGEVALVHKYLEKGASQNWIDSITGVSALHLAAQNGSVETAKVLIEAGAHLNLQAASNGFTPLMNGVWYRNPEMVEYLLRQEQINPFIMNHLGLTAEHLINAESVRTGPTGRKKGPPNHKLNQAIRKLFDRYFEQRDTFLQKHFTQNGYMPKANVNARIPNGNQGNDYHTALLIAARDGKVKTVKKLLKKGADITLKDEYMKANAAHKAAYNGHSEVLKTLAEHPDFHLIKNEQGPFNGYTPLHDAVWQGHENSVRVLLKLNVDKSLKGRDGMTPYELAKKYDYAKIQDLLR